MAANLPYVAPLNGATYGNFRQMLSKLFQDVNKMQLVFGCIDTDFCNEYILYSMF